MTETGADLRVTDADHDELVGTGCLGLPVSYREARIADPAGRPLPAGQAGELLLRGPGMMDGYAGDPQATEAVFRGGWMHTGDLARMDERGRVYLVGRLKDMIRRSGENVAAREVEDVLQAHPRVAQAAVTGVPDELAAFCRERLAAFKVPRYWQPADDLPRTSGSERVAKAALADLAGPVYDVVTGAWSTP